jgi:hypothetical protein
LNRESIIQLIEKYEHQVKGLKEEALRMCWYMRGGLTYDEAFCLGFQEREIINSIIKSNMEITQKTGTPFF